MVKKKKGRSVKRNPNVNSEPEELTQAPHSFIIQRGLTQGHIIELTRDFRKLMEPFTAKSLQEHKKNTIKDFVSVAGLLHVTHLCIFSQTEVGMYFKVGRLPRGPTLTFKVQNFSLAKDVVSSLKKQLVVEKAFKHSPLIILNSFSSEKAHMKLMASMFQNMFPKINLTNVDLNKIRRCVLLNYDPSTDLIDFRHYIIKIVPVGVSKGVKKVIQGKIPDLSKCDDISEFFTRAGTLSESEMEDDPNSHITVNQKLVSRGNVEQGQSAIKLTELGPRMTLQLMKVEDGLLDGIVLYHHLIHKTEEEKLEIQRKRDSKRKLKEKRKKIQEANKKRKEIEKEELKQKSLKGMHANVPKTTEKNSLEENDDDVQYYRDEVGEEPDKDLFLDNQPKSDISKVLKKFKKKKTSLEKNKQVTKYEDKFEKTKEKLGLKGRTQFKRNKFQVHNRVVGKTFNKRLNVKRKSK
ncbi:hypothetical protein PPYR_15767 [Photinus pyralis]|uniref:Brix domain-containing protein n=2 Tax=Photinus pyralis TaxID=7054 RepID=A0A5N4A084_PHOPY|nr:protein Peter pan-like [Photinus pyralis]KAB0790723.1 hypothetical protein PPYR_15767 [Photinus pyralis]